MGISTQTITVDLSKQLTRPQVVRLGQGDKRGTTLVADIYDNGAAYNLTGKTARFSMRAPDGTSSYSATASSYNGNKATFDLDETYAASIAGKTDTAYIEVLSGSTVICSTSRITVIVYRSASQGLPVAGAYSDALSEAISSAQSAASSANSAASNANTKATRAENAATAANNAADSVNAAKDAANAAASAATTAAGSANTAAEAANSAKDAANAAATAANTAAGSANAATSEANAAIEAMGDISELAVPEMTASVRGGAKVGGSTQVIGGKLEVKLSESATGTSVTTGSTSALKELQVHGKSVQNGTPTPDAPVPVQVVEGPLSLVIGDASVAINLQGNTLASINDIYRDTLDIDSTGHITLTRRTGKMDITTDLTWKWAGGFPGPYVHNLGGIERIPTSTDDGGLRLWSNRFAYGGTYMGNQGRPNVVCLGLTSNATDIVFYPGDESVTNVATWRTWLEQHPTTLIYPLTDTAWETIDLGYITPPAIPSGSVVTVSASLTPTFELACWTEHASELADMPYARIPEFGDGLALDDDTLSVDLETADGVLPVAHGGTGLAASPSALVDLASSAAASMMQASPRPGVEGTLPVAHGGTGATTAAAALTALGAAAASDMAVYEESSPWASIKFPAIGVRIAWANTVIPNATVAIASPGYGGYRSDSYNVAIPSGWFTSAPSGSVFKNGSQAWRVNGGTMTTTKIADIFLASGVEESAKDFPLSIILVGKC